MTLVTVGNFKRFSISEHMPQAKTAAAARIFGLYHPYPLSNCCNLDSPPAPTITFLIVCVHSQHKYSLSLISAFKFDS